MYFMTLCSAFMWIVVGLCENWLRTYAAKERSSQVIGEVDKFPTKVLYKDGLESRSLVSLLSETVGSRGVIAGL